MVDFSSLVLRGGTFLSVGERGHTGLASLLFLDDALGLRLRGDDAVSLSDLGAFGLGL